MPMSTRFLRLTAKRSWVGAVIGALALAATAAAAQPAVAAQRDAVVSWNENAGEAALAACIAPVDNPLYESRLYATTHVAIHDAHLTSSPRGQAVRDRVRAAHARG